MTLETFLRSYYIFKINPMAKKKKKMKMKIKKRTE